MFRGFEFLGVILVTAIPFGIYDLVEAIDNVESAAVAGDSFPTTRVLTADGVVSLIGCLMGNPFINAVYIGHPGWKAMGGRIGYSAATGVMVILLSWLGVISVMVSLVPVVAISPILLYIAMLIGAQSFQETPKSHAPAIILALAPHLAAWGKLQIDGALHAAGTSVAAVGFDKLGNEGILYQGLAGDGRRLDPGRPDAGRDRRLRHRPQLHEGVDLLARGRGADLLRLHARREDRLRRIAGHGAQLPRRRDHPLRLRPLRRRRHGARADARGRSTSTARNRCPPRSEPAIPIPSPRGAGERVRERGQAAFAAAARTALHLELDVDAIADQHAAGLEHLVPAEAEVLAVERRLRDESDPLVAPRILGAAAVLDVERHLARHVADGEIADDAVAIVRDLLDARAAEARARGSVSTSKKSAERRCVSRCAVPVSMLAASIVASTVDRVRSASSMRESAAVLGEAASHLRDHHVADREVDARVDGVDVPVVVVVVVMGCVPFVPP